MAAAISGSGRVRPEVALAEHVSDPETWQAPLTKYLTSSGADADEAIVQAAQQLLALLDPAGTAQGNTGSICRVPKASRLATATSNTTPSTPRRT
jgi:hypothetical protein